MTEDELQAKIDAIMNDPDLKAPKMPTPPCLSTNSSVAARLENIQRYITSLEYNFTGTLYFDINKKRSFKGISSTAKKIMKDSLPIQCLEAVFLASYLTAGISSADCLASDGGGGSAAATLDRLPISFKSFATEDKQTFRHIVLAVRHKNQWGALGLSRSSKLMYKELKYPTLSSLIEEFKSSYESVNHTLDAIYIGLPISHDIHSNIRMAWRTLNLSLKNESEETTAHINKFSRDCVGLSQCILSGGKLPESFTTKFPLHLPSSKLTSPEEVSPKKKSIKDGTRDGSITTIIKEKSLQLSPASLTLSNKNSSAVFLLENKTAEDQVITVTSPTNGWFPIRFTKEEKKEESMKELKVPANSAVSLAIDLNLEAMNLHYKKQSTTVVHVVDAQYDFKITGSSNQMVLPIQASFSVLNRIAV